MIYRALYGTKSRHHLFELGQTSILKTYEKKINHILTYTYILEENMISQLTLHAPSSYEEIDLRTTHSQTYGMPFFTMTIHLDNVGEVRALLKKKSWVTSLLCLSLSVGCSLARFLCY